MPNSRRRRDPTRSNCRVLSRWGCELSRPQSTTVCVNLEQSEQFAIDRIMPHWLHSNGILASRGGFRPKYLGLAPLLPSFFFPSSSSSFFSLTFPSPLSSPANSFPSLPLEVAPLNTARGSGECCSFRFGVWGGTIRYDTIRDAILTCARKPT